MDFRKKYILYLNSIFEIQKYLTKIKFKSFSDLVGHIHRYAR
jgi:hypothetical protein